MYTGDQGESRSEPWTYSRGNLPTSVYTDRSLIKCGIGRPKRVKARRKKNYIKPTDVVRISKALRDPISADNVPAWIRTIMDAMKDATLNMLEKIIPFLDNRSIQKLYDFVQEVGMKIFRLPADLSIKEGPALQVCRDIAWEAGFDVTFKKR